MKTRVALCRVVMSALLPKADMCSATRHVRFVPIADILGSARGKLLDLFPNNDAHAFTTIDWAFVGCSSYR